MSPRRNPHRSTVLEAARSRGRFCRADLVADTGLSADIVGTQVRRLLKERKIHSEGRVEGREMLRHHDLSKLAVAGHSAEAALWTAMRTLRRFEPLDLVASLAGTGADIDVVKARGYCQALLRAGYVRCVAKAVHGVSEARYHLTIDSGPLPPHMKRLSVLVDPNEERVAWVPEVTV